MSNAIPLSLRRCTDGDADALAVVGSATFLDSYAGMVDGGALVRHCQVKHAPEQYRAALADAEQALWLVEAAPGQAPVGYLQMAPADLPVASGPGDIEIRRIYLLSRFHGRGMGRRLLEAAISHARDRGCERLLLGVYQGNALALAFYRASGFVIVGDRDFDVGGRIFRDHVMALALPA